MMIWRSRCSSLIGFIDIFTRSIISLEVSNPILSRLLIGHHILDASPQAYDNASKAGIFVFVRTTVLSDMTIGFSYDPGYKVRSLISFFTSLRGRYLYGAIMFWSFAYRAQIAAQNASMSTLWLAVITVTAGRILLTLSSIVGYF